MPNKLPTTAKTPQNNNSFTLPRNVTTESSFTLVELLIVIGILAILTAAVVIAINPAELLKQGRDSQRMQDLSSIDKALSVLEAIDPSVSLGTASTVYVSVPDSSATCANLGLPSLPTGWSYGCVASSTLYDTDGTGWIPVNFSSSASLTFSALPIDPTNTTSTGNYYTYAPGGSWKLMTLFESEKYSYGGGSDKTSNDGGGDDAVYEAGSNKSILFGGPMYGKNDLKYSEDFPTGWGGAGNIQSNVATAPDGSANADYNNTAATGFQNINQQSIRTYQSGTPLTFSVWLKSDEPDTVITLAAHIGGGWSTLYPCTLTSSWERCTVTWTMTADYQSVILMEFGSYNESYNPFYIWGAQISNTDGLTPYIRTTSAPLP